MKGAVTYRKILTASVGQSQKPAQGFRHLYLNAIQDCWFPKGKRDKNEDGQNADGLEDTIHAASLVYQRRDEKPAMIEFRNVSKVYMQGQRSVAALDSLSLTISPGEFVAVTGPSGSGKSSLLHLASGLDVPTEGQVSVAGQELRVLGDEALTLFRRQHIGLVFQFFNLIPTLNVLENTVLPAMLSGARITDVRSRAEKLLQQVGLKERMTHRPEELSGGEMQRVAIARALINNPPILLADEPTGNLDSVTGAEIMTLLQQFHGERTLVVITHDLSMAKIADRTVNLKDGRLA